MSSLQHAKENNYNQFTRLIDSLEDRYKLNEGDAIVDINSLQVVRTRSGRVSKPRITPKSKPAATSSVSKSKRGRKQSTGTTRQSTGSSIPLSQSTQDSSGFESATYDSQEGSPLEPNLVVAQSILFDRPAQLEATKNLLSILESGGPLSSKTASNLYERFRVTLGRDELPNKASVRPFFTFHEDHDIGVTLLFDTPDLTPWTLICLKFFGEENLGLYQQIYRHVLVEAAAKTNNGSAKKMITSTPTTRSSVNTQRSEYLAVVAVRRSGGSKQMDMDSESEFGNHLNHTRPANQPAANKSPSGMSSAYTSPTSIPVYHPSIDSIVYENDKQLASLQKLAEIMRQNDDESKQVKRKLIARAGRALGHDSMPYGENIYPFFTFHEKGEIGVSFLFNIKTLSPWTTICKLYFGGEILNICSDIYRMMNRPQIESLEKLEQLAISYRQQPQQSKILRAAISQVHDERSKESCQKSNQQPSMSTPITRSSRAFSPVVINNTAPPYRRSIPQSPASSLSGSIEDSPIPEPRRARMLCRTTSVRRVTRPRKSTVLVDINNGNIQSTGIDLALTPPALKKTRRSTTFMVGKGFSEPSFALAKSGRKPALSRVNTTHHL
ncbi:uncharacterized protein LOC128390704 [Panonychus citri]|uniref:uncharacterized protein LOC128388403 n=1 Tax=Panonychus citri TaxID=50023 RepID=UPI0023078E34|nr:uncharacterized protein LOC128388403 [Panonychus citri]XP_053206434.1 uncharacterized protein LOC128390704 [Panonychus citri]